MTKLKVLLLVGISLATVWDQVSTATVPSPSPAPSIELFFPVQTQDATNNSSASQADQQPTEKSISFSARTTASPSISDRIHATLTNVLQLPIPIWETLAATAGGGGPPTQQILQQQPPLPVVSGERVTPEIYQRPQSTQQTNSQGQKRPQLIGAFKQPDPQVTPGSFLPLPDVNEAIHSTIAQLSTLSHWPFSYVSTTKPQGQPGVQATPSVQQSITQYAAPIPPSTTAAPVQTTPFVPSVLMPTPPPLPPAGPTQPMSASPLPPSFAQFVLSQSNGGSNIPFPPAVQAAPTKPPRQSLPSRIHNRIHNTINNYIRLPNFSQLGMNRPRPMLTEPPWVTELLGPTLEPPTTRAPTLGERVHNSIQNVLLFVPATLLNFWYQNWGTQQVDNFVSRLQYATPRPGSPASPVFATIPQGQNPFANFTTASFNVSSNNSSGSGSSSLPELPAIAAFINTNGTLMPTIVHPVVNKTANTIEYQLRGQNETTVLWTGTLSNDIFFGNKKPAQDISELNEDDEDYQAAQKNDLIVIKDV